MEPEILCSFQIPCQLITYTRQLEMLVTTLWGILLNRIMSDIVPLLHGDTMLDS